jgi:hypothetical protein
MRSLVELPSRLESGRIVALNVSVFKTLAAGLRSKGEPVIRKLSSGKYRLYSRKKDPKTGKRRNLGTFNSKEAAKKHERAVQYFKRH